MVNLEDCMGTQHSTTFRKAQPHKERSDIHTCNVSSLNARKIFGGKWGIFIMSENSFLKLEPVHVSYLAEL